MIYKLSDVITWEICFCEAFPNSDHLYDFGFAKKFKYKNLFHDLNKLHINKRNNLMYVYVICDNREEAIEKGKEKFLSMMQF